MFDSPATILCIVLSIGTLGITCICVFLALLCVRISELTRVVDRGSRGSVGGLNGQSRGVVDKARQPQKSDAEVMRAVNEHLDSRRVREATVEVVTGSLENLSESTEIADDIDDNINKLKGLK